MANKFYIDREHILPIPVEIIETDEYGAVRIRSDYFHGTISLCGGVRIFDNYRDALLSRIQLFDAQVDHLLLLKATCAGAWSQPSEAACRREMYDNFGSLRPLGKEEPTSSTESR